MVLVAGVRRTHLNAAVDLERDSRVIDADTDPPVGSNRHGVFTVISTEVGDGHISIRARAEDGNRLRGDGVSHPQPRHIGGVLNVQTTFAIGCSPNTEAASVQVDIKVAYLPATDGTGALHIGDETIRPIPAGSHGVIA